jgi:hypothetical protein
VEDMMNLFDNFVQFRGKGKLFSLSSWMKKSSSFRTQDVQVLRGSVGQV